MAPILWTRLMSVVLDLPNTVMTVIDAAVAVTVHAARVGLGG